MYLILAVVALIVPIGGLASAQYGAIAAASICAAIYLLISLLFGDGARLLLAGALARGVASWIEVALAAIVLAGLLLTAGFMPGGIVTMLSGFAIDASAAVGLLVVGYHHHQGRGHSGSKPTKRRLAGS